MNAIEILAIILILGGIIGLAVGKFTYTKETHDAKIGPIDISVKDKETVNIPFWASVVAILAGGLMLAAPVMTRK